VDNSLDASIEKLNAAGLNYRIGEECDAHTTLLVEEKQVFPTVFLVKYHFDTSGWVQRLANEFADCSGGKFSIGKFKSLSVESEMPANFKSAFCIDVGNKNQIFFESGNGEGAVISDLIQNLEIVIA